MDVGCIQWGMGSGALTTTLQHHSGSAILPQFSLNPPPHLLHRPTSVGVDSCAHPQHIKVLKHFGYIRYGCVQHFTGVWSLNHDVTISLQLSHTPIFLKSPPHLLHRPTSVRVHPSAHPRHIKVIKHFVYIWHECGMHSKRIWSLNHDITTSLGLGLIASSRRKISGENDGQLMVPAFSGYQA